MIKEINNRLIELGYISYIRKIENRECVYSHIENNLNSVFFVYKNSNKVILDYTIGQIPIEKEFSTIEELLDFIKEVFPLEEK